MSTPRVNNGLQDAAGTAFDNAGTGLAASNVQDATVELDGRSIFLRRKTPTADVTIGAGYFALWHSLRVSNAITFRIDADATMRLIG